MVEEGREGGVFGRGRVVAGVCAENSHERASTMAVCGDEWLVVKKKKNRERKKKEIQGRM